MKEIPRHSREDVLNIRLTFESLLCQEVFRLFSVFRKVSKLSQISSPTFGSQPNSSSHRTPVPIGGVPYPPVSSVSSHLDLAPNPRVVKGVLVRVDHERIGVYLRRHSVLLVFRNPKRLKEGLLSESLVPYRYGHRV